MLKNKRPRTKMVRKAKLMKLKMILLSDLSASSTSAKSRVTTNAFLRASKRMM